MSTREAALLALKALLTTALYGADVKRNSAVPEDVGCGGMAILRDGDLGQPEVSLSPATYAWEHVASVELFAGDGDPAQRDTLLDTLLTDIDAALLADPTLGGAVDHAEAGVPELDVMASDGGTSLRSARLPVTLIYITTSPLG